MEFAEIVKTLFEILKGVAVIASYIVLFFVSAMLKNQRDQAKKEVDGEDPHVTHKEFLAEKDNIFCEIDKRIDKATADKATKESIEHLQNNFTDLKKNVETNFNQFQVTLQQMAINIAVLAERRSQPRESEIKPINQV